MKLVIVESPAKAKTISRFLGKDYKVVASYGHVRDLPSSADEIPTNVKSKPWARMGVDTENGFTPIYVVQKDSKKVIAELKKLVSEKQIDEIILATDEDREGESISWHLLECLKPKVPVKRIAFHEITQHAINDALAHPRHVNQELVSAQEGRRILDRLYGYSLSPVLWKKVGPKLSAGRVQSVAVRLVVEREEERKAFKVSEYWDVEAKLSAKGKQFDATLVSMDGKRLATGKDFDGATGELKTNDPVWVREADAQRISKALEAALPWHAARVEQKQTRLRPDAPFITASLQRAASSLLGFSPKRTMQIAQKLYEGVDLGGGDREGLITYMRTDSVTLSNEALNEAAGFITDTFGKDYHERRAFSTKSKMAQEAHEAIRPTKIRRTPDSVANLLDEEALRLYRLIWNRTVASQMADAQLLKTTIDFEAKSSEGVAVLRSNGSVVTFPGFLRVSDTRQKDSELPDVKEGDRVGRGETIALEKLDALKHETKPPARYTEAALIQRLEEEGIGRPSTYAPILSTIQQRGYVELQGKALVPTFTGVATTKMLKDHFGEYVDLGFTARMEDALDEIAAGQRGSVEFLKSFYHGHGDYGKGLEPHIESEMDRIEYPLLFLGEDPKTRERIVVRIGRNGPFIQRGEGGADNTVSIPMDVTYEALDADKALDLLRDKRKSNEPIGTHSETGEPIFAMLGPYGPYVQLGERTEENKKPKRASLPKGMALEEVDLALAERLLSLPRELGQHPDTEEKVSAAIGRFGPYVKCGDEFRSLEKTDDVYTITFDRAMELLRQPKKSRRATKTVLAKLGEDKSGNPVELCEGRYGPYVTNGEVNASVPKDKAPADVTLEEALQLLADAPAKKTAGAKRRAAPKKKATSKAKTATKKKSAAKKKPATKAKVAAKPKQK